MVERILGVDYGEKRIGMASGDLELGIATPLQMIEVRNTGQAADAVKQVCEETGASKVVVGLPLNMDGSEGSAAEGALAFVARLRKILSVPVDTWDERLSTRIVERVLLDADVSRAKRRGKRDKLAAQVILQGYLDAGAAGSE